MFLVSVYDINELQKTWKLLIWAIKKIQIKIEIKIEIKTQLVWKALNMQEVSKSTWS